MTRLLTILCLFLTAGLVVAQTRVRVTGLTTRSESDILTLMGDRLAHVTATTASAPRADDAAFILRQMLVKDGHSGADVAWKLNGQNEIILIVREGTRKHIGQIKINGVDAVDGKYLAKLFRKPAEKDKTLLDQTAPFRQSDVQTGLSYVRQELNTRGYWQAEVSITSQDEDPLTGAVNITIDTQPGPLFQIGKPSVICVDPIGAKLVAVTAGPFIGRVATTGNVNLMRLAVEEAIAGRGYPDAQIRMSQTLTSNRFVPAFTITLGKRLKLRQIQIKGLERTNPKRIAQRMKIMEGEWYDVAAMNLRLREFLSTGAFASAQVETNIVGNDVIDATMHFEEANARELSLAAGFGTYQGIVTRATYADRNLYGNLLGFSAGIELGSRGILGEVRLTDPWLFGSDLSTTARAYALIYTREGYQSFESGIEDRFTWKYNKHYTLELLAGYSVVSVTGDGLSDDLLGDMFYTHPRVRISHALDFRDNPVLPKSGWHIENAFQMGAAVGDLTSSYVVAGLTGGWHHKINKNYDIGIGGEWSMIVPSGNLVDLPIDMRLFNGGARTVRSFPERELGPTVDGYPTGGEIMWSINAELHRKLTETVKLVSFLDAGNLTTNDANLNSSGVELAAGLGLRIDLPVGPVRFEYGYNLTQDPGDPVGTFHFAIGSAF